MGSYQRSFPNGDVQGDNFVSTARGIRKAHSLSEEIGDTQFVSVLDLLQIGSMATIRNLDTLKRLVAALEDYAARPAA